MAGACVSDLVVLAGQGALFGAVASVSTARRVLLSVGPGELDAIRQARAVARERAWRAGSAPAEVLPDFDAFLVGAHTRVDADYPLENTRPLTNEP